MKADIFFFISSLSSIVLSLLAAVLLIYLILVARNLHSISKTVKNGFEQSAEFFDSVKESLQNNLLFRMFAPTTTSSPKKRRAATKK